MPTFQNAEDVNASHGVFNDVAGHQYNTEIVIQLAGSQPTQAIDTERLEQPDELEYAESSGLKGNWMSLRGPFPPGANLSAIAHTPDYLDVFLCGSNGCVYNLEWGVESGWSGGGSSWMSIGGSPFFAPGTEVSAVARKSDQIDLFVCGNDGCVHTSWWSKGVGWSSHGIKNGWKSLGGFFLPGANLSALTRTPNNLDLFVCGNDGQVYNLWWEARSGVWSNWRSIGGSPFFASGTKISAVTRKPNQIDLFVFGNDGCVHTSWWSKGVGWSSHGINNGWNSLGGLFLPGANLSAIARTPDNLDLFVCGNDGQVYNLWWEAKSGVWSSWRSIGGSPFFAPGTKVSAVTRKPDQIDLFVCGNDGCVHTSWWSKGAGWSSHGIKNGWNSLGGFFLPGANLSAIARTPDHLDLFVCGNDGRVDNLFWEARSGVWSSWRTLGTRSKSMCSCLETNRTRMNATYIRVERGA